MATVQDQSTHRSFRLVAIHLDHRDEEQQIQEAEKVVRIVPKDGLPLLVCGDMNSDHRYDNNGPVPILMHGLGLYDTHHHTARRSSTVYRAILDYMLFSRNDFFVSDAVLPDSTGFPDLRPRKVPGKFGDMEWEPSDHYPVMCRLSLSASASGAPLRTGGWRVVSRKNCYDGHGGRNWEHWPNGDPKSHGCMTEEDARIFCESRGLAGFTRQRSDGKVWLLSRVQSEAAFAGSGGQYDVHVRGAPSRAIDHELPAAKRRQVEQLLEMGDTAEINVAIALEIGE